MADLWAVEINFNEEGLIWNVELYRDSGGALGRWPDGKIVRGLTKTQADDLFRALNNDPDRMERGKAMWSFPKPNGV